MQPASDENGFRKRYGGWAVVTGASDGIGAAFARQLAARGVHLVLVARRGAVLEAFATELKTANGIHAIPVSADLANPAGVERVKVAAAPLDVGLLVAAAGFGTSGPLIEAEPFAELEMVDVNCRAVLDLAQHFGKRFSERGRGGMILMSSLLAFQGVPRAANYAATKAYVQTLAEALHEELGAHGVDVLSCAPGPIRSGFAGRANMRMGMAQTPDVVARETLGALGRRLTVRPGWLSKALEMSLALLPRAGRVRALARVMQGMTAHH